jgi:hypothetical protein
MNSTLQAILGLVGVFFAKNPTVEEIELILPQVVNAIANAKTGVAFSVTFPEAIGGKPGTSTFGWSPT